MSKIGEFLLSQMLMINRKNNTHRCKYNTFINQLLRSESKSNNNNIASSSAAGILSIWRHVHNVSQNVDYLIVQIYNKIKV